MCNTHNPAAAFVYTCFKEHAFCQRYFAATRMPWQADVLYMLGIKIYHDALHLMLRAFETRTKQVELFLQVQSLNVFIPKWNRPALLRLAGIKILIAYKLLELLRQPIQVCYK